MAVSATPRQYDVRIGCSDGSFVDVEIKGANARRVGTAARKFVAEQEEIDLGDTEVYGVWPQVGKDGETFWPKIRVKS